MGLENIKHKPIIYCKKSQKPYFSSILKSTKNLLESCIKEKNDLLDKMKANDGKSANVRVVADCILLCYLCPELKLQNVNKCIEMYKNNIKNTLIFRGRKLKEIKSIAKNLATDNSNNGSRGALIHAIQSFPRVGLFCKELKKLSKKQFKIEISTSPPLWNELSSCGKKEDWKILQNVYISAHSLDFWCHKQIKKINDSSDGVGYFKDLYDVTNDIAAGRVKVATELVNKGKVSKMTNNKEKIPSSKTNKSETNTIDKKTPDSGYNQSSTQNAKKKAVKRIKYRMSNMKKRIFSSRNKTKE